MNNEQKIRQAVATVVLNAQNHPLGSVNLTDLITQVTQSVIGTGLVVLDNMITEFPKVTRVELIDNSGRAYIKYGASEVGTSLQDDGHTLKLFLRST